MGLQEFYRMIRRDLFIDSVGGDGKQYSNKATTRLFDEVVMTSPRDGKEGFYPERKADGVSERIHSGKFNEKMEKALKDGANPTAGLKAAAASHQSPEVILALIERGADPATQKRVPLISRVYSDHASDEYSAIQHAAGYDNTEGVRVMWDHINKTPEKYPDFTPKVISRMAENTDKETTLYIVDRAKKELSPEDYHQVMQAAMKAASIRHKPDVLEALQDRGGVSDGDSAFARRGLMLRSLMSEETKAGMDKAFIRDLNNRKDLSPAQLTEVLDAAVKLGSAPAVKAAMDRGADPFSNNAHSIRSMMIGAVNPRFDVLETMLAPAIARGSDRDKMMLMSIRESFDADFLRAPKEASATLEIRKDMLYYLRDATDKYLKPAKVSSAAPVESVDTIYTQLMDRLKVTPSEPKATVSAGIVFKPDLGLAAPAFG